MFKFKKKKIGYNLPGSYVGAILSATHSSTQWRILEYNDLTKVYYRSVTSSEDPTMTNVHIHHTYSHKEINDKIATGYWKVIKRVEDV